MFILLLNNFIKTKPKLLMFFFLTYIFIFWLYYSRKDGLIYLLVLCLSPTNVVYIICLDRYMSNIPIVSTTLHDCRKLILSIYFEILKDLFSKCLIKYVLVLTAGLVRINLFYIRNSDWPTRMHRPISTSIMSLLYVE